MNKARKKKAAEVLLVIVALAAIMVVMVGFVACGKSNETQEAKVAEPVSEREKVFVRKQPVLEKAEADVMSAIAAETAIAAITAVKVQPEPVRKIKKSVKPAQKAEEKDLIPPMPPCLEGEPCLPGPPSLQF